MEALEGRYHLGYTGKVPKEGLPDQGSCLLLTALEDIDLIPKQATAVLSLTWLSLHQTGHLSVCYIVLIKKKWVGLCYNS